MKVVCIGYFHGAGGAERQITLLTNELSKRGHSVTLIALAECNIQYKISDAVTLINLALPKKDGILARFRKLRRVIKELMPDVIINYWFQSAYFSVAIRSKYRGKIIYSERGDPGDREYGGLLGLVRKYTLKRIDGFVFQSKGARDYFHNKILNKSIVIPNSVSIPKEKLTRSLTREKRIVSVGRLHRQKNQKLLINAFAKIVDDLPEYTLEIYGDGELHDELQKQINGLSLNDRILIRSSCTDLFDKIQSAALFVLVSDYEGMPNALMEAMALGLPCISTDCKPGGARELIENGNNGIIVPVNNAECLAEKIKFMILNPLIAEQMALNARQIVETHSVKQVFDAWENFCKSVVEK